MGGGEEMGSTPVAVYDCWQAAPLLNGCGFRAVSGLPWHTIEGPVGGDRR